MVAARLCIGTVDWSTIHKQPFLSLTLLGWSQGYRGESIYPLIVTSWHVVPGRTPDTVIFSGGGVCCSRHRVPCQTPVIHVLVALFTTRVSWPTWNSTKKLGHQNLENKGNNVLLLHLWFCLKRRTTPDWEKQALGGKSAGKTRERNTLWRFALSLFGTLNSLNNTVYCPTKLSAVHRKSRSTGSLW